MIRKLNNPKIGAKLDIINAEGASVLMKATRYGHQSCVKLLVEKGYEISKKILYFFELFK